MVKYFQVYMKRDLRSPRKYGESAQAYEKKDTMFYKDKSQLKDSYRGQ